MGGEIVPRRVVICKTPFAAFEPQIAVAAASFNTTISLISAGATFSSWENSSSVAVAKSKSAPTAVSSGIPSTTIIGWLFPLIEVIPLIRIDIPLPGSPELDIISTPAIRPWRASSTEATLSSLMSSALNFEIAIEISRSSISSEPTLCLGFALTTISFNWSISYSVIFTAVFSPINICCFLYPTKLNDNVFLLLDTNILKLPSRFVTTPFTVRLSGLISATVAPTIGKLSVADMTVPRTKNFPPCAEIISVDRSNIVMRIIIFPVFFIR